ncbi:hypothetical protein D7X25_13845 [bacterium 1XD42-8]|nr:hypothetical protein D7X25_13845 [bacterium 1XD42-8]
MKDLREYIKGSQYEKLMDRNNDTYYEMEFLEEPIILDFKENVTIGYIGIHWFEERSKFIAIEY